MTLHQLVALQSYFLCWFEIVRLPTYSNPFRIWLCSFLNTQCLLATHDIINLLQRRFGFSIWFGCPLESSAYISYVRSNWLCPLEFSKQRQWRENILNHLGHVVENGIGIINKLNRWLYCKWVQHVQHSPLISLLIFDITTKKWDVLPSVFITGVPFYIP